MIFVWKFRRDVIFQARTTRGSLLESALLVVIQLWKDERSTISSRVWNTYSTFLSSNVWFHSCGVISKDYINICVISHISVYYIIAYSCFISFLTKKVAKKKENLENKQMLKLSREVVFYNKEVLESQPLTNPSHITPPPLQPPKRIDFQCRLRELDNTYQHLGITIQYIAIMMAFIRVANFIYYRYITISFTSTKQKYLNSLTLRWNAGDELFPCPKI